MNDLTVSIAVDGKRIATLRVEADSDVITDTLYDAGWHAYNIRWQIYVVIDGESVLVPWPDLTTEQQLRVVYQEVIYVLTEMAKTYHINAARTAAGKIAETEATTRYDI